VFPLRRPSTFVVDARTVLAVKGSLRRAERALACCAPFWREGHAMGGSGGNTSPELQQQKRKACFLLAEKAGLVFKQSNRQYLEKVLTGRSISETPIHAGLRCNRAQLKHKLAKRQRYALNHKSPLLAAGYSGRRMIGPY
jgi:hypothetical protein